MPWQRTPPARPRRGSGLAPACSAAASGGVVSGQRPGERPAAGEPGGPHLAFVGRAGAQRRAEAGPGSRRPGLGAEGARRRAVVAVRRRRGGVQVQPALGRQRPLRGGVVGSAPRLGVQCSRGPPPAPQAGRGAEGPPAAELHRGPQVIAHLQVGGPSSGQHPRLGRLGRERTPAGGAGGAGRGGGAPSAASRARARAAPPRAPRPRAPPRGSPPPPRPRPRPRRPARAPRAGGRDGSGAGPAGGGRRRASRGRGGVRRGRRGAAGLLHSAPLGARANRGVSRPAIFLSPSSCPSSAFLRLWNGVIPREPNARRENSKVIQTPGGRAGGGLGGGGPGASAHLDHPVLEVVLHRIHRRRHPEVRERPPAET